ncbi:MAG: metallophosphoesterase [Thermoplasmatota archaeon]
MREKEGATITEKQRERGTLTAMMLISVISIMVISASVLIGSVYSILFSPGSTVQWQYITFMISMTLFIIFAEIIGHAYHGRTIQILYLLAALMMGAFFYMLFTTSIAGPILLIGVATGWNSNQLLMDVLRLFVLAGVVLPMVLGIIIGRVLRVRKVRIGSGEKDVKPIRIALISDVHIGLLVGKRRSKRILEKTRESEPDIIISAGDLIDTNPRSLSHIVPYLKELTSIAPSYAIIGNHEFYHGIMDSKEFLKNCGFEVLDNRMKEDQETGLSIIGVDDPSSFRSYHQYEEVIEKLVRASKSRRPMILVNHHPLHFKRSAELGVDLMLSGHTHSGQMFPAGLFTRMVYREGDRGLYKYGESYMYVCYGSGTWGPPMRVGAPSEIAIIDLLRTKSGEPFNRAPL